MKEALKLALEALEKVVDGWTEAFAGYKYDSDIPSENQFRDEVFAAITAIKEALAQPEQEYKRGYADAMNWKVQNHLEHLPTAQPKEPVIFLKEWSNWRDMVVINIMRHGNIDKHLARELANHFQNMTPQRTWVGLTDEEENELWESTDSDWELMKRTEAKLKEKNI